MKFERFLSLAFGLLFFLVPFLFYPENFELFEFNKIIGVYGLTIVISGLWIARMVSEKKVIFRRSFLDLPLVLFLLSQLFSVIFSIDRHVSLWGYYSRFNGGFVSLLSYAVLFWAYVSNFQTLPKIHLKLLLFSALLISFYGILEHVGVSPSCAFIYHQFNNSCWVQDVKTRVFATLGQPNWLAAWLVAISPIGWSMAAKSKIKNLEFISWTFVSTLLFLTTLYTKSRSGFLALIAAILAFATFIIFKKRNSLKPVLLLNSLFLAIVLLSGTPVSTSLSDLLKTRQADTQASSPVVLVGGETWVIRKIVWPTAIKIGLAHPLFGTGVETFAQSYYQYRPIEHNSVSEWDFLYNKAHNEFLNYFANSGFFGLGTYLFLIGTFVTWATRTLLKNVTEKKLSVDKLLLAGLLSGYLSILITNFFGFSVVTVQILFFLFPAIAIAATNTGRFVTLEKPNKLLGRLPDILTLCGIAIVSILFLQSVAKMWLADAHYSQANQLFQAGQSQSAFLNIQSAVDLVPNEPVFKDLLAQSSANLALIAAHKNEATIAAQLSSFAADQSTSVVETSPYNLQFWTSRSRVYYTLSQVDPSSPKLLETSLEAITRATKLAPTHPKILYNLALIQVKMGLDDKAKESLQKAISFKPDYKDPRLILAILLAQENNFDEALSQANYILQNIDSDDQEARMLIASWSSEINR